ncbi:MAG TPA: matrixin family metalloprotease [Polyangiaceae bacterium]|nr:matrixin family metalloprotease [Polyangiaceae bacterium]
MRSRLLALAVGCAGFFGAVPASADYCRTKACDNQPAYDDIWQTAPDPPCIRDSVGCLIEGTPLYWPQSCISFSVQQDGSPEQHIDYQLAHDTITKAFYAWLNVDCGGGLPPSVAIADYSPAVCDQIEYNKDQPNANVFMFRDGTWPYVGGEDTLALTTVTYNTENAQIYDADVEINSAQATFTFSDDPLKTVDDLQAVLTHECGHFLGLSHDPVNTSTMFPEYSPGELYQRNPGADDIAGICDIYPPGQDVDTSHCLPRHGFSRDCAKPQSKGCGITRTGDDGSVSGAAALLAGVVLVGARRRSRRRRTP